MQNRLENLCKAGIFSNNSSFWFLEKPKKGLRFVPRSNESSGMCKKK